VTSYGGQCRDAGSVRHIRLFRRRRPNRHHTRVSDEAGSRRSGRVAQPALHCDRNCRRPSTPCAINRRPTASLRALAEVKKARCFAGPSKQGDRASVQSAAFYQQWRFNLFLRMFCEDSIFLHESPQPSRSADIRCTEHQYAQTFCAGAAMLRTKHFMFPLIPCGSRGPPKAALLF
jgi:hypothetical protein